MRSVALAGPADFSGWRAAARDLICANVRPDQVEWLEDGASASLFGTGLATATHTEADAPFTVPRSFLELAADVALHSDPAKFPLLYRLLWRLRRESHLLRDSLDADVARAFAMRKAVERDIHKMHAFLRFREVVGAPAGVRIAWFEPEHHIVEAAAPFFVRRFANLQWSILTPERSAHWDMRELSFGPGARRSDAPAEDAHESLWRTYYASIFNPARLKPAAMRQHMPKKYWRNLPESPLIPQLIAAAGTRTQAMLDNPPTPMRAGRSPAASESPELPQDSSLQSLRLRAQHCRDCPLWEKATQTVFGEGPQSARIVFVGEQPGDQEDLAGRPFVGPAGKLFDAALAEAGIDRKLAYVTNAVKHFKFEPRGKRRIHKKPSELEVAACSQWLRQELQLMDAKVVVALGATAARALFGRAIAVGENRGTIVSGRAPGAPGILVTVHPSYLLRVPDDRRDAEYSRFVSDLRTLHTVGV